MTDRKNIKIDAAMYERLREAKSQYETWNGFFDRLLDETGGGDPGPCAECGATLAGPFATTPDGDVLCLECAGVDS